MMKSTLFAAVVLAACTAHAQSDSLVRAAIAGDLAAVKSLLAAGADVNERLMGETAFSRAVGEGHADMAQALLAAGADVNEPCCALHDAARARDVEMVKVLLAAKADPNRRGKISGNTALMWGISQGTPESLEIARLVLEAGADVNVANDMGVTALSLAVQLKGSNSEPMVKAILARGAEVDHRRCVYVPDTARRNETTYGRATRRTALGVASSLGNTAAVRALIAAKADVNLAQCDGETSLALASENGHEEVANILRSAMAAAPAAQ